MVSGQGAGRADDGGGVLRLGVPDRADGTTGRERVHTWRQVGRFSRRWCSRRGCFCTSAFIVGWASSILAATLGHIVLFDIGQLDTLGKAISFFVLGLVVLGVGFFYVRFQSKFRDLL